MSTANDDPIPRLLALLPPLELLRIAPMDEAKQLSGLSQDTLRRDHSDKIFKAVAPTLRNACGARVDAQ